MAALNVQAMGSPQQENEQDLDLMLFDKHLYPIGNLPFLL